MAGKRMIYNISGGRSSPNINTIDFFDRSYVEPDCSAIDIYNSKRVLHVKLLGQPQATSEWELLVNLVMLGFVSLVESYCRCIIRRILLVDTTSMSFSYANNVSYAAALHHAKDKLPEALLEDASFISEKNIIDTIKKFTGLSISQQGNQSLASAIIKYEQVCQLRHCIVHRSGHLGTKNAIKLGFDEHCLFLEKPILINYDAIQSIIAACDNIVKELNDELLVILLSRIAGQIPWSGDFRRDKKFFSPYFDLFYSSEKNRDKNEEQRCCYSEFVKHHGIK